MRLHPSAAERITQPLYLSDEGIAANDAARLVAYLGTGDPTGLVVVPGCPTFTFHPLSPRQASAARRQAAMDVPAAHEASSRAAAVAMEHDIWEASGCEGPEPLVSQADRVTLEAHGEAIAYAYAAQGLVSIDGSSGLTGAPAAYLDRLPVEAVLEIAGAVRRASEVPDLGKASSGSQPSAQIQTPASGGTASPASPTGSEPTAATAAARSHAESWTDTPTPTPGCLGREITTAHT